MALRRLFANFREISADGGRYVVIARTISAGRDTSVVLTGLATSIWRDDGRSMVVHAGNDSVEERNMVNTEVELREKEYRGQDRKHHGIAAMVAHMFALCNATLTLFATLPHRLRDHS